MVGESLLGADEAAVNRDSKGDELLGYVVEVLRLRAAGRAGSLSLHGAHVVVARGACTLIASNRGGRTAATSDGGVVCTARAQGARALMQIDFDAPRNDPAIDIADLSRIRAVDSEKEAHVLEEARGSERGVQGFVLGSALGSGCECIGVGGRSCRRSAGDCHGCNGCRNGHRGAGMTSLRHWWGMRHASRCWETSRAAEPCCCAERGAS